MTQRTEAVNLEQVAHHDLGGNGDGMQIAKCGDILYVGHVGTSGAGTSILDVADINKIRMLDQWSAPTLTHTHKVQVADGLLLVNHERFPYGSPAEDGPNSAGLAIYDIEDPRQPTQVGFWQSTGRGVHRIVWRGGRYAGMSAVPEGFSDRIWVTIDLADPANPVESSRWWWPGQWTAGGEELSADSPGRIAAHHALPAGDYAYLGYDDVNLVVLDTSVPGRPEKVADCRWGGGATHTCMPLGERDLLVVTDEQQKNGPRAARRDIHLVDISTPTAPQYLRAFPRPDESHNVEGMRFGPHNLHENQPGSFQSDRLVFSTWFSAGVRVYDLADPLHPREIASWVPEPPAGQAAVQSNDLYVDSDGVIWVSDRIGGGLAALKPTGELAELMGH